MSHTIVLYSAYAWDHSVYVLWPYSECVSHSEEESFITTDELVSYQSFAERYDRSPKGDGSGPFFVAKYYRNDDAPTVDIDSTGLTVPVRNLLGDYSHGGGYTYYYRYAPSIRQGKRIVAYAAAWYRNDTGRFYNCDAGYIPLTENMIDGSKLVGTFMSYLMNQRPKPPSSIRDNVDAVLTYLIHTASTTTQRFVSRSMRYYNATYQPGHEEKVDVTSIPLKFNEHGYYTARANPDLSSPFVSPGSLHPGLFSSAYYRAQDNLPQLLSNTFQNILEAGQLVVSLANGIDLSDLRNLKSISGDAWLAYRYQYNTTVSDLEELESAIERFDTLSRAKGHITSYGSDGDPTGVYHCAISIDPAQILDRNILKRLNLRPTLANAWDMIPYSFIIDWFTNIGDVLAAIDKWLDAPSYGKVKCWYSYTNTYEVEDGVVTCYFRYAGGRPSLPYWSMDYSHNGKTWAMRATDVVSLLL